MTSKPMYFQNEDQEDQNEDQKTPPWHPEIRSQFLLTRTPPFLAFGLNQPVMLGPWLKGGVG